MTSNQLTSYQQIKKPLRGSAITNPPPDKFLYYFLPQCVEGSSALKDILGSKGAHLAEMTSLGLPIPPGFTISSKMCNIFYNNNKCLPNFLKVEIKQALSRLGKVMGSVFGDKNNPLLVSVRSGARVSMPGMMDSILNLGLNDWTVESLARQSSNEWFAWDCYRRFIQMYADVVLSVDSSLLVFFLEDLKKSKNYKKDTELTVSDLQKLTDCFKEQVLQVVGKPFPQDPEEQLYSAVGSVFNSWNNSRAISYRELNHYPNSWGTAVNIQAMVFGNKGDESATGVVFTRDPSTGDKSLIGEFLVNAQGEDVVAGVRTPLPITQSSQNQSSQVVSQSFTLEKKFPSIFNKLKQIAYKLEQHYKDIQDIEWTVEKGRLWVLQTRSAKRTAQSALKVALDMLDEGLITDRELLFRVSPKALEQILHPRLDPKVQRVQLCRGLAASPGGVSGRVVFSSSEAVQSQSNGEKVILVRSETSPEDIKGMISAEGILTIRGGITSHAAVVARGMGKCCVVGCDDITLNEEEGWMKVGRGDQVTQLKKGDVISLDGSTGEVFLGAVATQEPQLDESFTRFMDIVGKYSLSVRANADHLREAKIARQFGAQGIGLCRTEHMFFGEERMMSVWKMILATKDQERKKVLEELVVLQQKDFSDLFSVMSNLPVTIRLLDPPLHEFLPQKEEEIEKLSQEMGERKESIRDRVNALKESNPMLGHRGCRLAISYPEIYRMQVRAIASAVCERVHNGELVTPEIMIPLVMMTSELKFLRELVESEIKAVQKEQSCQFKYLIGTMIELPRAALIADELADYADFFSFGTNDLTQTVFGISRDDCGKFLPSYISENLLTEDPFTRIDPKGVGFLIQRAVELGRGKKPKMKMGVCGEHGAEQKSIYFFSHLNLDYVSCSAYRVPLARLISARANIEQKLKKTMVNQ